jgi:hypothetical protein
MSMLEFDSRYIMPVLTNHGVGGERIRDQYRLTEHRQNLINEQEALGSPRSRAAAAAGGGGGGGNGVSSSPFHRVRSAVEDMEGASSLELKSSSSSSNGRTVSSDDEGNNSYSECDTVSNHEAQSHQRLMRSSRNTRRPTPVTSPTSNHSRNKPKVHVVAEEIAVI